MFKALLKKVHLFDSKPNQVANDSEDYTDIGGAPKKFNDQAVQDLAVWESILGTRG